MDAMEKQAARFEAEIVPQSATRVDLSERPFGVWSGDEEWRARTLIVSTGATAKWLGVPGEERLRGRGVSACATCDGFFFRERELLVVGGGDTAMEEATFLTKFASKVTVVHRRDTLRASKIMQERAFKNPKIAFQWNSVVEKILGGAQTKVTGAVLRNVETGETSEVRAGGIFMAIGHEPNTAPFRGQIDMDAAGYIITAPRTTATSVRGVFAAGDVQDPRYRQAVTAAGTGCMAAIDAERFLGEHVTEDWDPESTEAAPRP
jgi:thioredoxin reductase (NADPH)